MGETEFRPGDVVVYTPCDGYDRCVCVQEDAGAIGIVYKMEHPNSDKCLYIHWLSWPYERPTEGPFPKHLRKLEVPAPELTLPEAR